MANTYTQIYIHIVFAVRGRQNLIRREHNDELQKYMTGIISGQGHSKPTGPSSMQELYRRIRRLERLQCAA